MLLPLYDNKDFHKHKYNCISSHYKDA